MQRLIRKKDVRVDTGLSASGLDREIAAGRFPRPIKLTSAPNCRAVGWPMAEVQAWIEARISGASDDDVRALVVALIEKRQQPLADRREGAQ